jgi:hypothetical protein
MARNERCRDYNQLLSAYLDGELSATERTDLLQHLSGCHACRAKLDEYRRIGTQIRGLGPVTVPDELTAAIYMHTVDAPPRRLLHLTNRIAYPTAAIAAVLLVFIVAVFLLVDGYQRSIDPSIVGSNPVNETMWNYNEPIRITFNKEMNRESVEAALTIIPTSERDRLQLSWEGNTLIIGGNTALRPGTSYRVEVTTEARDKWGNRLTDRFQLGFQTSTSMTLYEPLPTPAPPATATPEPAPAVVATSTPEPPTATIDDAPPTSTPAAPETATNTPETSSGSTGGNGNQEAPSPTQAPAPAQIEPTQIPAPPPPPTETPVPPPTETPTIIPPTETPVPPATEEPEPTPTQEPEPPTVTPVPEPTATATPDTVAITGAFGNVYWRNESVQQRLGLALSRERPVSVLELDFQRGKMLLVHETGQVYVMQTWGAWERLPDTSGDDLPEFLEIDEAGLWEPGGVLGHIWHSDPYYLEALGYAVDSEARSYDSLVQDFDTGRMIYNPEGFIYVLYQGDGMWELYPDAGPLSDTNPGQQP